MEEPDPKILIDIVNYKMPYGRFKDRLLCDLPIEYIQWLKLKDAIPKGRLGMLLLQVLEMKEANLYHVIYELKKRFTKQ